VKRTILLSATGSLATLDAHAQSAVTLYGKLDAGIAYLHNVVSASVANQSGNPADTVSGKVFAITPQELAHADAYEVSDYRRERVALASGVSAWVYIAADSAAPDAAQ
jgi:gamma-glutamylcyclotransferase (GGCT)/AIG2-like uncharacterized protein YtfP